MISRLMQTIALGLPSALAAAGALLALTGCPGSLDDPAQFEDAQTSQGSTSNSAPCDAPDTIFTGTCAAAGCHNATSAASAGNLDLASSGLLARLVNQPAPEMPSLYLIDTAVPAQSVLYTKLSPSPPYGQRMPFGGPYLSADMIQCVLDWIGSVTSTSQQASDGSSEGTPSSSTADSSTGADAEP